MAELVDRICSGIEPYLDMPFSFFGHSMGALICFEVAQTLARQRRPKPRWLFVSGAIPPHRRPVELLHTLPTSDFIKAVSLRYNGLPPEVLADKELLDLYVPIMRADFELVENYRYGDGPPLSTKIAAFGGRDDPSVPPLELERWSDLTTWPEFFRVTLFDGDHFFLNNQRTALLNEICARL
jgi:medium-chain acyl-[acyl-carrier-protein] hydrolase